MADFLENLFTGFCIFVKIVRRPNSTSPFLIKLGKIIRKVFSCAGFQRKSTI